MEEESSIRELLEGENENDVQEALDEGGYRVIEMIDKLASGLLVTLEEKTSGDYVAAVVEYGSGKVEHVKEYNSKSQALEAEMPTPPPDSVVPDRSHF